MILGLDAAPSRSAAEVMPRSTSVRTSAWTEATRNWTVITNTPWRQRHDEESEGEGTGFRTSMLADSELATADEAESRRMIFEGCN